MPSPAADCQPQGPLTCRSSGGEGTGGTACVTSLQSHFLRKTLFLEKESDRAGPQSGFGVSSVSLLGVFPRPSPSLARFPRAQGGDGAPGLTASSDLPHPPLLPNLSACPGASGAILGRKQGKETSFPVCTLEKEGCSWTGISGSVHLGTVIDTAVGDKRRATDVWTYAVRDPSHRPRVSV